MAEKIASPENDRWIIASVLLLFIAGFFLLPQWGLLTPSTSEQLLNPAAGQPQRLRENFAVYFLSIVLEAAPYMVIGAFLSALIEIFVPGDLLPRISRRLGVLGIPAMALVAPLFPICECAVVIVARRLFKKGLPLSHTLTYLLAAPIVNPVVLTGTWLAFYRDPLYPLLRGAGGVLVAVAIGYAFYSYDAAKALRTGAATPDDGESCAHGCGHAPSGKIGHILGHVRDDFLAMGSYFLMGVFLASCLKTFVPWQALDQLGNGPVTGPVSMGLAAFVMSLCSEADAFLAASFVEFDLFSHMAFLVLGPMLDIKLILMYRTLFTTRFILLFSLSVIWAVGLYIALLRLVPDTLFEAFLGGML